MKQYRRFGSVTNEHPSIAPNERDPSRTLTEYTRSAASPQGKTLVNNTILEKHPHFDSFPHCLEFHPVVPNYIGKSNNHSPRGKITHFSKRARFRLFHLLSKIDDKLEFKPIFCTLTYHYGHENTKDTTKSQLHHFLTRLRQADPRVQLFWRIELQKRGAPHYHLIIFPGTNIYSGKKGSYDTFISLIWHEIADPKSYRHKQYGCKIIKINSYSQACSYMSKYIAKQQDINSEPVEGKHWGCSRNLPIKMLAHVEMTRKMTIAYIERIRRWLMENGREKYADPHYLNYYTQFTVFIDYDVAEQLLSDISGESYR
ncbi:hypothetical protein ES708_19158 [subsurface metagenome]